MVAGNQRPGLAGHGQLQKGNIEDVAARRCFRWWLGNADGLAVRQIVGQQLPLFIRRKFELRIAQHPNQLGRRNGGNQRPDAMILPDPARAAIERGRLLVSPIVELELQYLHEIGRITRGPGAILPVLAAEIGLAMDQPPLAAITGRARELSWTRDPFDRLIVANALHAGGRLVTKDALILKHCKAALW